MQDDKTSNRLAAAITRRWRDLPRRVRWWWAAGLVLILAVALLSALAPDSCLRVLATTLLVLWAVPTVFSALLWVWRKLTYRIGVRLLISYFLIGVVPFPMFLALAALGGYMLLGQYASAELGDVSLAFRDELERRAEEALAVAEEAGPEAAVRALDGAWELRGQLAAAGPHVHWLFAAGAETWRGDRAGAPAAGTPAADTPTADTPDRRELQIPEWMADGSDSGPFLTPDGPVMAAIAHRGEHTAAVLLPLGPETAAVWSAGAWYEVSFSVREMKVSDEGIHIGPSRDEELRSREESQPEVEGIAPPLDEAESEATSALPPDATWVERLWRSRWIYFLRPSPELRRWEDGSPVEERGVAALIRTSPKEVAADFFASPHELGRVLLGVFLGFATFFLFVYLGVVLLAVLQIFAITRSTARLTRGTRRVQAGDLEKRIPVKRRDQLGDLAVAFNQMTESVEHMLTEVEEKERLKHELELAREIQQSLLPGRHLEHGSLSVHAVFRPATEVGGDYFDLFPLERGRLIVAAGDVAGHGLSTGLLMAMVKSAVATLVHEGHRGVALLERLNRFMLQQPREHRMVTLAVADIDVEAGFAEITNAAHPPVFLSGCTVREVMLPALPVGFVWQRPPPSERLELEAGSRLVFYSDGLVEAVDDNDEAFGYEQLRDLLTEHAELPSKELLATLLSALEVHTGGRPLDDDLTILVIDCGAEVR